MGYFLRETPLIMRSITPNLMQTLLIFAKWPEPGRVKTRLSPPLTQKQAASLYQCMLMDTLAATSLITGIQRMIFFDGNDENAAFFQALAPDVAVYRQQGMNLGERLSAAFAVAFELGHQRVAIIGTDSPHLDSKEICSAFALLSTDKTDVVFGPSEDGGYYLVGLRQSEPELFRDIHWSSSTVLNESLARAKSAGLRQALLAPCFDLDTVDDLHRLTAFQDAVAAPQTRSFLAGLSF
jgi:rSAM/selenodomain-associated transferase 1